jgi:lipoprotein signal peptidase
MPRSRYLAIALAGLIIDQSVKQLAMKSPLSSRGVFIIDEILGFGSRVNSEFAWSLPTANTVAAGLSLAILIGLTIYCFRRRHVYSPLALIFAGAISNLADRIFAGGVIDYILLPLGGATNLADVMIMLGLILLFRN